MFASCLALRVKTFQSTELDQRTEVLHTLTRGNGQCSPCRTHAVNTDASMHLLHNRRSHARMIPGGAVVVVTEEELGATVVETLVVVLDAGGAGLLVVVVDGKTSGLPTSTH